jgi:hypothetical protein
MDTKIKPVAIMSRIILRLVAWPQLRADEAIE